MWRSVRRHWFKAAQVVVPVGAAVAGGVLTVLGIRKAVNAKEDVRRRTLEGEFDEDWAKFAATWPEKERARLEGVRAEYIEGLRTGVAPGGPDAHAPSGSLAARILQWDSLAAQQKRVNDEKAAAAAAVAVTVSRT